MNTSSDKLVRLDMAKKEKSQEINWISSNSSIKQHQRTNYIKAKIDKMQQNSKYRLCGNRDEIVNHIISKCSKLGQKEYKTRHDWVGKVVHWKMCKFGNTTKWYINKLESVLKNKIHKILWDFHIEMDYLILARRLEIMLTKKKPCYLVDLAVPADHRVKIKENKKRDKYLNLAWEQKKKTIERDGDNNYS